MQVTREHVVHMLRIAALPELAEEVHRVLPDPVEYHYVERYLAQYGITKDGLISRRGGSPQPMTGPPGPARQHAIQHAIGEAAFLARRTNCEN